MERLKKEFITDIDFNKSAEQCPTCYSECEKIDKRINGRNLSEIKTKGGSAHPKSF